MMSSSKDVSSIETSSHPRRTADFGLVVGVDHYPHFRPLKGAIADAKNFHAWMCDGDGGGVAPQHARLVLSTPEPPTPIHPQIDATFGELIAEADTLGGGRRLYFYFSGHGATCLGGPTDDVALLLASWSRSFARLALSSKAYKGELTTIGLFEEIVILLDCCRSTAERVVGLPPTMTPSLASAPFPTREFVAYATEAGRSAFEVRDEQLWQGVFTRRLTSILRRSVHGITACALKDALECEIAATGQQAHVINELRAGSTFGRRGALPQLEIRFENATGRVRLRDGRFEIVAEQEVGSEPWRLSLEAGLYKLEGGGREPFVFQHGASAVTHVEF
jgi:hypothetical protein